MKKNNRLQKVPKLYRNRLFYDQQNQLVLIQWPNIPLLIWLIGTIVVRLTTGTTQLLLSTVATTSLTIWAVLEMISGVNYFRKCLGIVIFMYIIVSRIF